jgi:diguanylate cyclase (GGDEF)-like protein/PAS domain S-box-containing protein
VYTKDIEGRYTYANAMVCELFGRPLDQIIGRPDEDFFKLSDAAELRENDLRVLKQGERVEKEEHNIIAQTGEERIYWSVKLPIRDADGEITGLCGISTDITERRRLEHELQVQKNLLSLVLENMDASVYIKDKDRRFQYVNANTARVFGMKAEDVIGKTGFEILPKDIADYFEESDREVLEEAKKVTLEETFIGVDGDEEHYWSIKIPVVKDDQQNVLIGMSTNITEIVQLKNRFKDYARTDELTGVLTRRFLFEQAQDELTRAQRRGAKLGALMIDIDYLKQVNDTHGHAMGDKYIIRIIDTLQQHVREGEFIGRLGGDEFVVILTDVTQDGILAAVKRFSGAVSKERLRLDDGRDLPLSTSIGVAISEAEDGLDQMLARADKALYGAKNEGRGCWRLA